MLILRILLSLPVFYGALTTEFPLFLRSYAVYVLGLLLFPYALEKAGIFLSRLQILWISLGLVIHPVGAIYGLYHGIWFYDLFAHFYASTIVSSTGIYLLERRDVSGKKKIIYSFAWITLLGTSWEIYERIVDHLTVYGAIDTATDYVFNTVGWAAALKRKMIKPGSLRHRPDTSKSQRPSP